jgi:hypothetical protein
LVAVGVSLVEGEEGKFVPRKIRLNSRMAVAIATRNNGSSLKPAILPKKRKKDDIMNDAVRMLVRLTKYRFKALATDDIVVLSIGSFILRKIRSKPIDELPIAVV